MLQYIPYQCLSGQENMDVDLSLLNKAINKQEKAPILRLYGWNNPTVSLGRNQTLDGINTEFCKRNNIDIVKRPTGGRALLHDKELTYSFIVAASSLNEGSNIISSYKEISSKLIQAFNSINIELYIPENKKINTKVDYCMNLSTGADICYKDKKFIGSAQFRKEDYILQHGSILLDCDLELLKNIFYTKNITKNFVTLKEINEKYCDIEFLAESIKNNFNI